MDEQKLAVAKTVARLIVMSGTSKIVHDTIKNNTDPEGLIDTVRFAAGSLALGGLVADAVGEHTDKKIDEAFAALRKLKQHFQGDTPADQ